MASLFRNSRVILRQISCISRSAGTTSTPGGNTGVRPSGASTNLSQTSRSADGTDMAMRDAKQRATSSDSTRSKQTGESSRSSRGGKSSNSWGKIGFAVILAITSYFIYVNYIKNPEGSKSLQSNKRDEQHSTDREGSTGKKH